VLQLLQARGSWPYPVRPKPVGTLRFVVTVTDTAARKIRELMASEAEEVGVLRIAIQGGGCSGFQYALGFDRGPQDGDNEIESNGVRVVIDPFSAPYLAGSEIDFVDALMGAGFAINNPNVQAACGCGSSFQAKEGVAEAAGAPAQAGGGCGCH
jgi:iron-sulfur cluster assembly accessory protein